MSESITVTGNKAQFNEDVTFLKDIYIDGSLKLGSGSLAKGETGVVIDDNLNVTQKVVTQDLKVERYTELVGITTITSELNIGQTGLGITIRPNNNGGLIFYGHVPPSYSGFGTERLIISPEGLYSNVPIVGMGSTGLVGIGLTAPENKLHIKGNYGDDNYQIRIEDANNDNYARIGVDGVLGNFNIDWKSNTNRNINLVNTDNSGSSQYDRLNVGIGTTIPSQNLHVVGSVRIEEDIYDSANSSGVNGYYLQQDAGGIRWIEASPIAMEGIYVQDEGIYLPTVGTAQTFSTINFFNVNSLGVGTDTMVAIPDPDNPTNIARIQGKDLWGFDGDGNNAPIYRMSEVGVNLDVALGGISNQFQVNSSGSAFVVTSSGDVGIKKDAPGVALDVAGDVAISNTLDVDGNVTFDSGTSSTSTITGALTVDGGVGIGENLNIGGNTKIEGSTTSTTKDTGALIVEGGVGIEENLNVGNKTRIYSTLDATNNSSGALIVDGGVGISKKLFVGLEAKIESDVESESSVTGALVVSGGIGLSKNLNVGGGATVGGSATIGGILDLESYLNDINDDIGVSVAQTDYRLASGTSGVTWRPSGVQTKRTIWVTKNGMDTNTGLLEGDAKATIGAAAAIAQETDTIKVRPGVYEEDNPIGLRTDVSITGEDLRLVTVVPKNPLKDVIHVRNGCLVENLNFTGQTKYTSHKGAGAVAFPPDNSSQQANSGYVALGPFVVPPGKRYKSPYVRNCTNFMCESIGMKIDGDHATAETFGQDLKSMVCDSFTQYNEAGVGVSLTNDAYAQLVSIFTINCDIAIYADSGGQCDLTNSNSSFGNFGLVAVGLGSTQFTGIVSNSDPAGDIIDSTDPEEQDTVVCANVFDGDNNARRPFDGQALFFKIDLDNYPSVQGTGVLDTPLERVETIKIMEGASVTGFSAIDPPSVLIRDVDGTLPPKGPQGIIAEATASVDATGTITEFNVIASGRNYLPTQNLVVEVEGNTSIGTCVMEPIYYTVDSATFPVTSGEKTGLSTITFNEFIPYELFPGDEFSLKRISRILTSSHSFEYVGTGTDINISTPLQGAIPIKANEIVASDGAQIPFTSTDQKGNFDIGEGIQINQTTSTVSGRDFSRAIQAEVTPLILALR